MVFPSGEIAATATSIPSCSTYNASKLSGLERDLVCLGFAALNLILQWKKVLARRFEQREIYIKSSGGVTWL
jgi:hypothetical protein